MVTVPLRAQAGWEREHGPPGPPVLPFCLLDKGPEASQGGPEPALTTFPHALPLISPEALATGKGQTAKHLSRT